MNKFSTAPIIDSINIPLEIKEELRKWNDEIAYSLHCGTGIYWIHAEDAERMPKFIAWMKEIGAWTNIDFTSWGEFSRNNPGKNYTDFEADLIVTNRVDRLTFGLIGD